MQSQLPLSSKHAHLGDPLVCYLAGPDFGSSFRRRLNPKQFANGWAGELKTESGTPWTWTAKVVPRVVAERQSIAFHLNMLIERGITRGRLALEAGAMLRGQK